MVKRKKEEEESTNEYENQRLARIRENKARLEALGISNLASSLRKADVAEETNTKKKKKPAMDKRNYKMEEDEEYEPSDNDDNDDEEDIEEETKSSSRKGKKRSSPKTPKLSSTKEIACDTALDDDEFALQKAIALSLESVEDSIAATSGQSSSTGNLQNEMPSHKRNGSPNMQESAANRKNKKLNKSRIQLTEDEVLAFFFSFDEVGKGYITVWDLERMVTTHDFSWTDSEITKMIRCFDSDGDGKINLEEFRTIVTRCGMLKGSGD